MASQDTHASEPFGNEAQRKFNQDLYEKTYRVGLERAAAKNVDFFRDLPKMVEEARNEGPSKSRKTLAPGTLRLHAQIEARIRQFTACFMEHFESDYNSVDAFLSKDGHPLDTDWAFLKLLMRYLARRDDGNGAVSTSSAQRRWSLATHLLQMKIDRPIPAYMTNKCLDYLHTELRDDCSLIPAKNQPDMRFEDLLDLLRNGCFSNRFRFKNTDDRLQFIAYLCVLAYTGARAGEIAVAELYRATNDALKYRDLDIYVFREADGRHRLEVDILIRNMKGSRGVDGQARQVTVHWDPRIPIVVDAASLLVLMAIRDGAIEGIETTQAFDNISAASFNSDGMLKLQIKPSMAEKLVFRMIDWDSERKVWVKDPVLGQPSSIFSYQLRHTSRHAELSGLRLKDIRRMSCNAMNDPRVPEAEAQTAVGHTPGTSTYRRHYISKHSTVNLQGLICHGPNDETTARLQLRRFPKTPYPELDDGEEKGLRSDERVHGALLEREQLAQDLLGQFGTFAEARRASSAQGDLETIARIARYHKIVADSNAVLRSLKHQARLEKGRQNLIPVQNTSLINWEEAEQTEELESVLHGARHEGSASEDATSCHQDAPFGLSSWSQLCADAQMPLAVAISNSLAAICGGVNSNETPNSSFDELFTVASASTADSGGPLSPSLTTAETLLSQTSGTQTQHWRSRCPGCRQVHRGAHAQVEWASTKACISKSLKSQAISCFASLVQAEQCPWPHCDYEYASLLENEEESAATSGSDVIENAAAHMARHVSRPRLHCPVKQADEDFCPFSIANRGVIELLTDAERAAMACHFEAAHGWPVFSVEYCSEHDEWMVGTMAIEKHFAIDVLELLEEEVSFERHCELCLHDETLRPSQRAKRYDFRSQLLTHVANCHVVRISTETITCVICTGEFAALDWADHLIVEHNLPLCGTNEAGKVLFLDNPFALRCSEEEHKLAYLSVLGLIDEAAEAQGPKLFRRRDQHALKEIAQLIGLPSDASPSEQLEFLERKQQKYNDQRRERAEEKAEARRTERANKQAERRAAAKEAKAAERQAEGEGKEARLAAQKRRRSTKPNARSKDGR